jgi:hypothetical protein
MVDRRRTDILSMIGVRVQVYTKHWCLVFWYHRGLFLLPTQADRLPAFWRERSCRLETFEQRLLGRNAACLQKSNFVDAVLRKSSSYLEVYYQER